MEDSGPNNLRKIILSTFIFLIFAGSFFELYRMWKTNEEYKDKDFKKIENLNIASSSITQKTDNKLKIKIIAPNGGESFVDGQNIRISWVGGVSNVMVGLADGEKEKVLGWMSNDSLPDSFIDWNGDSVCDLGFGEDINMVSCSEIKKLSSGPYKIVVVSADKYNNLCWLSGGRKNTTDNCNYDFSDYSFEIDKE